MRIGVLVDDGATPRFVAAILEDIARTNFAEVDVAIVTRARRRPLAVSAVAHAIYDRFDRAMQRDSDPLAMVSADPWLGSIDRLDVIADGDDLHADRSTLEALEARGLDVILRFSAAPATKRIRGAARFGVWSYHFGSDHHPRGGAPFFRDVAGGAGTLDVQLEALRADSDEPVVLCKSTFSTLGSMFLSRQREAPMRETTHFVVWKLHELHERGWDHVQQKAERPSERSVTIAPPPSNTDVARFVLPRVSTLITNGLRGRSRRPVRHRWYCAIRRTSTPLSSTPGEPDASDFRAIDAPNGRYYADPFLFVHQKKTWLFCEEFVEARGFAGISRAEVDADGSVGPVETCLDPGFHLSFPNVFEHDGEIFMIPESNSNGTVTLYRARRFPDVWVHEKVLFRGNAVDTAVWSEGGRFYFFTTMFDADDRGMKTILFVADSLTGAWRMHPRNPISSDIRTARGAGAMFRRDGRLFRPIQDCGPHYGYALMLDEIVALDEERYEARQFCRVEPKQVRREARGVHTYNQSGDLEVVDFIAPVDAPP